MLTVEDATRHLERAARELEALSYDELAKLAEAQDDNPELLSRYEQCQGTEVYIDTAVVKLGRLRKRVSVEMILTADGWEAWARVPCVYFERYASGKLYRPLVGPLLRWLLRIK